jgi:hypothetical protein
LWHRAPCLDPDQQSQLFAVLREVAAATEQVMPRNVYLVNDVNAWVTRRGGFAGIGSRRVMGAARVAGARNAIDALTAVHRAGAAFQVYWESEVIPLLSNGFRLPVTAAYRRS